MIELRFTSDLHASVIDLLATSGFPAVLRIGKAMEVLFNVATVGSYTALIDEQHREGISSHPITLVGGQYMALSHVMVTLIHVAGTTYLIQRMEYFDATTGWHPMIADGTLMVVPPAPDPDWLPRGSSKTRSRHVAVRATPSGGGEAR